MICSKKLAKNLVERLKIYRKSNVNTPILHEKWLHVSVLTVFSIACQRSVSHPFLCGSHTFFLYFLRLLTGHAILGLDENKRAINSIFVGVNSEENFIVIAVDKT
jgi:hypothetical protein